MAPKLTPADIQRLGFDWPGVPLIEQYIVIEEGLVDLDATIDRIASAHDYYRQQVNDAFNFKSQTGADYSDFSDNFDDEARMERGLRQALAHLRQIVEAAEKG